MKKLSSVITIVIILLQIAISNAYAAPLSKKPAFGNIQNQNQMKIISPSAIVIDAKSKKILYQKNSHAKLYPASTTKILTALIALEKGSLNDIVTADRSVNNLERGSSIIGLKVGEKMTLHELLYGLLLESGNDAAVAIAIHIGGSVKGFSVMMNQKTAALGLHDSNFINPNGLYDKNHYTSVYDLAMITFEARKYQVFKDIVNTFLYEKSPTNITPEKRTWINSNRLISHNPSDIFRYAYATGVKTGYTVQAKHSLVASAKYEDTELISAVMDDTKDGKWTDCIQMFNYGFNNFSTYSVDSLLKSIKTNNWTAKITDEQNHITSLDLQTQYNQNQFVTMPRTANLKNITALEKINSPLKTPIKKGDLLGKLQLSYNHEILAEVNLVATRDVTDSFIPLPSLPALIKPANAILKKIAWQNWWWIIIIALAIVLIARVSFKKNKRYRRKNIRFRRSRNKH